MTDHRALAKEVIHTWWEHKQTHNGEVPVRGMWDQPGLRDSFPSIDASLSDDEATLDFAYGAMRHLERYFPECYEVACAFACGGSVVKAKEMMRPLGADTVEIRYNCALAVIGSALAMVEGR